MFEFVNLKMKKKNKTKYDFRTQLTLLYKRAITIVKKKKKKGGNKKKNTNSQTKTTVYFFYFPLKTT